MFGKFKCRSQEDTEDGLFSRFSFYQIEMDPRWRSPFPDGEDEAMDVSFDELLVPFKGQAYNMFQVYNRDNQRFRFKLTSDQQYRLNEHYSIMSKKYALHTKTNAIATIRRQGVICFRLAGILTAIRCYDAPENNLLICSDEDFQTALAISDVFIHHAFSIAKQLPESNKKQQLYSRKQLFLENLPDEFMKKEAVKVGELLELKEHSVEKYLESLVPQFIERWKKDHYRKVGNESQRSV